MYIAVNNFIHFAANLSVVNSKLLPPRHVGPYLDWRNYNKYTRSISHPVHELYHSHSDSQKPSSSQLPSPSSPSALDRNVSSFLFMTRDDRTKVENRFTTDNSSTEKDVPVAPTGFPSTTFNSSSTSSDNLSKRNKALDTMRAYARRNPNSHFLTTMATTTTAKPTGEGPWINDLTWDDATWILTASFIIFTMQTDKLDFCVCFGMLESGCVSIRNESNIMMKNVVDVVFGGLTYWLFGFSISFGTDQGSTPYLGVGEYLVDADNNLMGPVFAAFMFQLSFATTATTIVSGTMAERCNFKAYCIFSLLNTVVYCVPARWIWGPSGFLGEMGVIDIAGSGAVHLLGGASGYVAAWMLGPRLGRYENGTASLPLGNPTSCIVGLYILWWGWLAFNSGSTFGVSGAKWKFAARAAVSTLIASIGGGIVGSVWTLFKPGRIFEVMDLVNPILGALVGITAGCALYRTIDAFFIGVIGGIVVIITNPIPDSFRVDDPVGATSVHAFGGIWGLVAVAIFAEDDKGLGFTKGNAGLRHGGGFFLMGVQLFAVLCITVWSIFITFILLWVINKFVDIRMEPHEELLGADFVEHLVYRRGVGLSPALSAMVSVPGIKQTQEKAVVVGSNNPIHESITGQIKKLGSSTQWKKLKARTMVASAFMSVLKQMNNTAASLTDQVQDAVKEVDDIVVEDGQREEQGENENEEGEKARQDRLSSIDSTDIVREYLGAPFTLVSRDYSGGQIRPQQRINSGSQRPPSIENNFGAISTISGRLDRKDTPTI